MTSIARDCIVVWLHTNREFQYYKSQDIYIFYYIRLIMWIVLLYIFLLLNIFILSIISYFIFIHPVICNIAICGWCGVRRRCGLRAWCQMFFIQYSCVVEKTSKLKFFLIPAYPHWYSTNVISCVPPLIWYIFHYLSLFFTPFYSMFHLFLY